MMQKVITAYLHEMVIKIWGLNVSMFCAKSLLLPVQFCSNGYACKCVLK